MRVNIDKLLKQQGKSRYWLAKEIEVSYPTMKNLADNNTESVKFETIEKICKALSCTPSELLNIQTEKEPEIK